MYTHSEEQQRVQNAFVCCRGRLLGEKNQRFESYICIKERRHNEIMFFLTTGIVAKK